jgi:hypothetical protein
LDASSGPVLAPLSWIPPFNYLVLSGLLLAILALSNSYLHDIGLYLLATLLPLAVGFFTLPIDGFRPVGLVAWGLLWLGFFLRRIWHKAR